MPVPGITPELPLRAKVRIGEKREGQRNDGSRYERAAALDYFVCPEPDFERICGPRPKAIRIHFPYERVAQAFPSGLEKWAVSKNGRPLLLCYTKGDDVAHGLGGHLGAQGETCLDPSKDRQAFPCAAGRCRYYGKARNQGCRPQARLNFQLVGGARDSVYRFETKSINSIEQIEAVLMQYPDLRGLEFELRVEMVERGSKHFPVVSISELASPSEALEVAARQPTGAPSTEGEAEGPLRVAIRDLLAKHNKPITPELAAWIKEQGYGDALRMLREHLEGE